jgi:hypothetical protein
MPTNLGGSKIKIRNCCTPSISVFSWHRAQQELTNYFLGKALDISTPTVLLQDLRNHVILSDEGAKNPYKVRLQLNIRGILHYYPLWGLRSATFTRSSDMRKSYLSYLTIFNNAWQCL